jgi:hypothetical protein
MSSGEFLARERNNPSVGLVASNDQTQETIKVLFVNLSRNSFFLDDTFPSGHSEPSALYVQSPDPARAHSLFHFFHEYLRAGSVVIGFFRWWLSLGSLLLLGAKLLSLVAQGQLLLVAKCSASLGRARCHRSCCRDSLPVFHSPARAACARTALDSIEVH